MSEPDHRPVPQLRVEDVRVDRGSNEATPDEVSAPPPVDDEPTSRSHRFRRAFARALDGWHVVPNDPWW